MNEYFGKYRGKVENNVDPLQLGRIQVSCPAVLGEGQFSWAMPCSPYAGDGVGLFTVPPVGANVWVEFEGGDPDYPIAGGYFWGTGEVPADPALPQVKVLKTDAISITLKDLPGGGGLEIEAGPPAVATTLKITLDASGIEISNTGAKVTLSPVSVSINDGALEVI